MLVGLLEQASRIIIGDAIDDGGWRGTARQQHRTERRGQQAACGYPHESILSPLCRQLAEEPPVSDANNASLYVVATPIGNLEDLGPRAARLLGEVALVAAEDTRHTGRLLRHLGLSVPMLSLHEHNEAARVEQLDARLAAGESIALVSDAGTPLISDPGFVLVRELRARGRRIVPVPGACALVAALSAAGLPTDRFTFQGFLPAKGGGRRARLAALAGREETLVFYESPTASAIPWPTWRRWSASGAWCWPGS